MVPATRPKIVRKNQNTLPPHLLSQPHHDVEVCRGREVSEAKATVGPFFADYLKGTCTRTPCEYWHPPECQFEKMKWVVRLETSACFRTRLINNRLKKPKKSNIPKRRESDDKNVVAIVKSVSQLCCVSQDSDALVSQGRKSRGNPMQKVLEPTQRVRFTESTLRYASFREKKGPSLGKINVKFRHQRSPYSMKFEDRSHERQQRCARSKARNLSKNIFTSSKKKQGCILLSRGGMGTPGCVNKRAGGEFVVDSGVSMHMVSKRDLDSAELETVRISRSPTTVMTANGEVQTREEVTENVSELDLFVKVMFLEETPAVLSLGKLCEDHGYTYHWISGQKPHLIRNGKRID